MEQSDEPHSRHPQAAALVCRPLADIGGVRQEAGVRNSIGIVTALNLCIGYANAVEVAAEAHRTGRGARSKRLADPCGGPFRRFFSICCPGPRPGARTGEGEV
ncbi:hypothetical protein [Azospirillum soli]|uniref:hypothetical protein n=1 Tax=Azospirillum soli TaxID=1304799 RepID=UPI001FEAA2A0|nr:hypothetical protein [Azospirillum soli]MBP2315714.1 hypothetical protein [Azospirillum soli]